MVDIGVPRVPLGGIPPIRGWDVEAPVGHDPDELHVPDTSRAELVDDPPPCGDVVTGDAIGGVLSELGLVIEGEPDRLTDRPDTLDPGHHLCVDG